MRGTGKGLWLDATGTNPGYLLGPTSPREQQFLDDRLSEGNVFYDVGTNVGFFAIIASRLVGTEGRVFAFEPLNSVADQCDTNLRANDFAHATVHQVALGENQGTLRMARGDIHTKSQADPEGDIEVQQTTLDRWRADKDAPPPDLLKIDMEGAELDVLRGAMDTIGNHRPVILVEVHYLGSRFLDYVETQLRPLGYSGRRLSDGGPLPELKRYHYHALLEPTSTSGV